MTRMGAQTSQFLTHTCTCRCSARCKSLNHCQGSRQSVIENNLQHARQELCQSDRGLPNPGRIVTSPGHGRGSVSAFFRCGTVQHVLFAGGGVNINRRDRVIGVDPSGGEIVVELLRRHDRLAHWYNRCSVDRAQLDRVYAIQPATYLRPSSRHCGVSDANPPSDLRRHGRGRRRRREQCLWARRSFRNQQKTR